MKLRKAIVWLGFACFVPAWFLTALYTPGGSGTQHSEGVPGWTAFWFALTMARDMQNWLLAGLSAASALTNVVMLVALVITIRRREVGPRWAWALIGAGVLNGWWRVSNMEPWRDLGIGYYLWWLSFFMVGWGSLPGKPARAGGDPGALG